MYLETGHTQNQNDSVHAVIERFAKNQTVYVPSQWFQIAKSACLKSPYKVKEMGMSDFYDLDKLCRETSDNFNVDINGVKVNFTEIRMLKVDYTLPDMIIVRTSWAAKDIKMIETIRRSRRGKASVKKSAGSCNLQKLYSGPVQIRERVYRDIQDLCKKNLIPCKKLITSFSETFRSTV